MGAPLVINHDETALSIYVDGSCLSRPRRGGIGFRFLYVDEHGNEVLEDICPPGFKKATNQEMELRACIEALQEAVRRFDLSKFSKIDIYSDSDYVVSNIKFARGVWPKTKWVTNYGRGSPVLNVELWRQLVKVEQSTGKKVQYYWVKGHSINIHNRAVDKLARKSAKNASRSPLRTTSVRRKTSRKSTKRGSVGVHGQRLTIRVIEVERLRSQKLWKYRYEVVSRHSAYFQCVDIAFSAILLRDGHTYLVTLNKNQSNPTIMKKIKEIKDD